jgi:hypothetical protein
MTCSWERVCYMSNSWAVCQGQPPAQQRSGGAASVFCKAGTYPLAAGRHRLLLDVQVLDIWEFAPLGYLWISMDIKGYPWIWKDIAWISVGNFGYLFGLIQKRYPLKKSLQYPDISITYPTHISMEDIHGYLSKHILWYPSISKWNIHSRYPLDIQCIYPSYIQRYPAISKSLIYSRYPVDILNDIHPSKISRTYLKNPFISHDVQWHAWYSTIPIGIHANHMLHLTRTEIQNTKAAMTYPEARTWVRLSIHIQAISFHIHNISCYISMQYHFNIQIISFHIQRYPDLISAHKDFLFPYKDMFMDDKGL